MARQTGPLRFVGTFAGITFCRNGVVRSARRSQKAEFDKAPSMARTRENATEFGTASRAAALLRRALRPQLGPLHSRALCSRLTSQMRQVLALDAENPRGQRQVLPENLRALAGFSLNPAATLPPALADGCTLSRPAADALCLTLPALTPHLDFSVPGGATHYGITVCAVLLDPVAGRARVLAAPDCPAPALLTTAPTPAPNIHFALPAAPGPTEVLVISLGLCFYQHHGGALTPLLAARANPLAIITAQFLAAPPAAPPALVPAHRQSAPARRPSPPAPRPRPARLPAPAGTSACASPPPIRGRAPAPRRAPPARHSSSTIPAKRPRQRYPPPLPRRPRPPQTRR